MLLLALGALVAKRLVEVWAERRRGLAGSRLQVRLVVLFSLIAVMPTIIVAVFSYLFFSFGVESWFSDKVRTAISESLAVAEAYLHEHQQAIRADALAMANDLNRDAASLQLNPQHLAPVADGAGGDARPDRGGDLRPRRQRCWRAPASSSRSGSRMSPDALQRAAAGRRRHHDQRQRRAGARPRPPRTSSATCYLYVGRFIEPRVLTHREKPSAPPRNTSRWKASAPGFRSPSR